MIKYFFVFCLNAYISNSKQMATFLSSTGWFWNESISHII